MMVEAEGKYSDGRVALVRPVRLRLEADALVIIDAQAGTLARWRVVDLRLVDEPGFGVAGRLSPGVGRPERLLFDSPSLVPALLAHNPQLRDDPYGRGWGWKAVTAWIAAAAVGIVAVFTLAVPLFARQVALLVPPEVEMRSGRWLARSALEIFAGPNQGKIVCDNKFGIIALERMLSPLLRHANLHVFVHVRVIDVPKVNAIALPGGQVMLFRGLIENSANPDTVAGVLAHEIAHVELRHPTENAIKRATTSFLIGLFLGDVAGVTVAGTIASTLIGSSYTRDTEAAADARALEILRKAGIRTAGFAEFFEKLSRERRESSDDGVLNYLSTHPPSSDRARVARERDGAGEPVLDEVNWQSLKEICKPAPAN